MSRTRMHIVYALAMVLACAASYGVDAASGFLRNPSFESARLEWTQNGRQTTAALDATQHHTGRQSYCISDRGDQMGQSQTALFPVDASAIYFVAVWLKIDPALPDLASVDVQFCERTQKHWLASITIGSTRSTDWQRLSGYVVPPSADAAFMRLRVMPATTGSSAVGACWIDDVTFEALDGARLPRDVTRLPVADDDAASGAYPPQLQSGWFPHVPLMDFEDLAGWHYVVLGGGRATFQRSGRHPLAGALTGRLVYSCPDGDTLVRLIPPEPLSLPSFDRIQLWVRGNRVRRGATPSVAVVLSGADGAARRLVLPPIDYIFWAPVDTPVRDLAPGAVRLEAIEFWGLGTAAGKEEELCVDNLSFYTQDTSPVPLQAPSQLPFPTRPETILPDTQDTVVNSCEQQDGEWWLEGRGRGGTIRFIYRPETGTLSDLLVSAGAGRDAFPVAAGGGPVFAVGADEISPGDPRIRAECVRTSQTDGGVTSLWRLSWEAGSALVEYRFQVNGRSLIVTVTSGSTDIAAFRAGVPVCEGVRPLPVPYLFYQTMPRADEPCVRFTDDGVFMSHLWDYYNSDATVLRESQAEYHRDTAGRRQALRERLFITVSPHFHEVLPTIPNPPSPWREVAGTFVYANSSPSDVASLGRLLTMWRGFKRYGMDRVMAKYHAAWWSRHSGKGDLPFVQTVQVSEDLTERACVEHIEQIKELGYKVALYTDYCLLHPMGANWDERYVSRDADGSWRRCWFQAYGLTPLKSWEFAAEYASRLEAVFNPDAMYCDQHTVHPPWGRFLDYDARKPQAAQHKSNFYSYGKVMLLERAAYGGPVYSEGGCHWFWAGLTDGNYAQLRWPDSPSRAPWLVDFDLLKLHPLEFDLMMGWRSAFSGGGADPDGSQLDRLLAASIAFGHYGLLYYPDMPGPGQVSAENPFGSHRNAILKTYFMMQQLQSHYAQVPVARIRYFDGADLVQSDQAILTGAYRRSQVRVDYTNGLSVWANGHGDAQWSIDLSGEDVALPPSGYAACLPGVLLEYSALRSGKRVDFVDAPAYLFADGRGFMTDFGTVRTAQALIVRKVDAVTVEVIPVGDSTQVALCPERLGLPSTSGLRVVVLDRAGGRLAERSATPQDGWLQLESVEGAFSFRIRADGHGKTE